MYIQGWYNIMNKKFSWRAEWIKAQAQVDPPLAPNDCLWSIETVSDPIQLVNALCKQSSLNGRILNWICSTAPVWDEPTTPGRNLEIANFDSSWIQFPSEIRANCIPVASEQDVDGMWGRIERLPRRRISNIGEYLSRWVPSSQCTIG